MFSEHPFYSWVIIRTVFSLKILVEISVNFKQQITLRKVFIKHYSLKTSGSLFFRVQVYKAPRFSEHRFFSVWVWGTVPGFRRSRPEGLKLYQKRTSTQVFYCEYSKRFKNSFLYRTPPVPESAYFFCFCFWRNLSLFQFSCEWTNTEAVGRVCS